MKIDSIKYIYFIGIGGIGMSALARYFNEINNIIVKGYDAISTVLCKELISEGISIHFDECVDSIPSDLTLINKEQVLIVYTPAIKNTNTLFNFFKKNKYLVLKRADVLGKISENHFTIAVSGTHGKTTTSCILAHILKSAGVCFAAFVGGISKNYNSNFIKEKNGSILIIEADEYDRSFLRLNPNIAVITSIDSDHLDIYSNFYSIVDCFKQFDKKITSNGVLVIEESLNKIFKLSDNRKKYTYSTSNNADLCAKEIQTVGSAMLFNILFSKGELINDNKLELKNIKTILPGIHNISNILAAVLVSKLIGINTFKIIEGVNTFKGIKRRYEIIINREDIVFIDDYAHHPKEIESTIETTKLLYPNRKITVVFQPHLYSRTKNLAEDFGVALSKASELVLLDIYPAREEPIKGISSEFLLSKCTLKNKELCSENKILELLKNKDIDVLLTLGAGDISNLVKPIKYMLN